MRQLLVAEYAREVQKSATAIYQKIKSGEIEALDKIGSKTYVIVPDLEESHFRSTSEELLNQKIKTLEALLKMKDEQITTLEATSKELVKSKEAEISTLKIVLDTFTTVFNRQLPAPAEAEIIVAKPKKKKRKKK